MLKLCKSPQSDIHLIPMDLRAILAFSIFLSCIELRPCKATNRKHEIFTSNCKVSADAQI